MPRLKGRAQKVEEKMSAEGRVHYFSAKEIDRASAESMRKINLEYRRISRAQTSYFKLQKLGLLD